MEPSNAIPDYIETLARELSFDRVLARRVCHEVEDHLWEAVSSNAAGDTEDAQLRAIERFGPASNLVKEYIASSLLQQAKRVSVNVVFVVLISFLAMEARVATYTSASIRFADAIQTLRAIAMAIDHWSFFLSLGISLAVCAFISSRRAPRRFSSGYGKRLQLYLLLCITAVGAQALMVISDTVLTATRLLAIRPSAAFAIPAISVLIEIALCASVVWNIRLTFRRMSVAMVRT